MSLPSFCKSKWDRLRCCIYKDTHNLNDTSVGTFYKPTTRIIVSLFFNVHCIFTGN